MSVRQTLCIPQNPPKPLSTLIVLGSGGHTAEMINVLNVLLLKDRFCPRFYVAAGTDNMSLQKAHLLEENVLNLVDPQVVLCNGPGTCVPLCVIAFLFKVVGVRWSSIFYVESIARRKYPRAHYVGCLM
ncbi:hypothetical protein OIU76_019649 [Salix suchowensis]|nr:hypothetical protein OIU76_019649 [Salix suchowensis]